MILNIASHVNCRLSVISTITSAIDRPFFFRSSFRCAHSVISQQVVAAAGAWAETGCNQTFPVDHWTRAPERSRRPEEPFIHESMSHTRAHPWNIRDLPLHPLTLLSFLSFFLSPSSLTSISPVVRFTHRLCVCASAKRQGIISRGREAQSCVAFVRARKRTREKGRKLTPLWATGGMPVEQTKLCTLLGSILPFRFISEKHAFPRV